VAAVTGLDRLRENLVYNVVGQVVALALSVVAVRLIFLRLGGDVVGVVFFVLTLSPLLSTALDLGLSTTVVREVSRSHDRDAAYVRRLCRTTSTMCWSLYALGAVLLVLSAPLLVSRWLHVTSLDVDTATMVVRLLGIGALTALPRAFYGSVLRGLQRMRGPNVIDVAMAALQQGGAALLLWRGLGSTPVVAWMTACFWLATAAYVTVAARHLGPRAVLPGWSPGVLTRIRGFAGSVFAISVLSVVSLQLDKLFVSKLLPVATFGVYSFIASLASRALVVSIAIALAAWPALSALLASGEPGRSRQLYRKVQDLQCLLAVPTLALPLYVMGLIAGFAFGGAATAALLGPLGLLCLGFCLQSAIRTPITMLIASGSPGVVAGASLLSLAVSAPLGLVATARLGMMGAALSWLLYSLVLSVHVVAHSARRLLYTTPAGWWLTTGRTLGAGLLCFVPPLVLASRLGASDALLAGLYGLACALFLVVCARGLMGDELRSSVLVLSRQLRLRLARST